jgi:hypothetical protein
LATHVLTSRSSDGGVSGFSSRIGRGSSFRIAPIRLAGLVATKARLPVTIS